MSGGETAMTTSDRDEGPDTGVASDQAFQMVSTDHHGRELRLRSEGYARAFSSILAVVFTLSLTFWVWRAAKFIDPCRQLADQIGINLDGCAAPPDWLRYAQFAVAIAGAVIGAILVGYLVRFAVTRRTWPYRRNMAAIFGVLAGVWVILYGIGALHIEKLVFGVIVIALTVVFGLVTLYVWRTRSKEVL